MKQWDKRFGGTDIDWFTTFKQTKDGGYILGGNSFSGIGGDKTDSLKGDYDYWIVKIDSLGNKQWDKDFGGTNFEGFTSVQQTADRGYILGGSSASGISGDKTQPSQGIGDYWVIKIDSLGTKEWDRTYGGVNNDGILSLMQTTDGGYILGGNSFSGISGDKTQATKGGADYWILKIDSLGNKQWDKDFGGTNNDELYSLQQTTDGGYILGGYSSSGIGGDKTQATKGVDDYWIVKIDSLGNKQWDKDFGGTFYDVLYSLQQTNDGGYILGGISASGIGGDKTQDSKGFFDYWMVKTDFLGNKQWDKDFGGTDFEDDFGNIIQTKDNGYLLAGTSYSSISGDKTENNLGSEQTWIVKTDSLGNKQWDKTIFTTGHDEMGLAIQTKDGCYVFAIYDDGGVGGYRTQPSQGSVDYWIIKFCDSTMAALPVANFISSDTAFCNEPTQCLSFNDYSTNNPTSWKWLFPGAVPNYSNQQNPTGICYYTHGTYPVTLIVSNAAGSDTLTVSPMITVGGTPAAPVITKVGLDTLVCSHAASYQWYFNGNIIAGATDSFYVAAQWGTYAVRITDSIGCSRLSDGIVISVNELTASQQLIIYPNPVDESLVIGHWSLGKNATIEIYSVLGEKVFSEQLQSNSKQETVNCKQFSEGMYFVIVADKEKRFVGKFVKE